MENDDVGAPDLRMANELERWMETGGDEDTLFQWLQGRRLPSLGHEEEPFFWILSGVSLLDDIRAAKQFLAARIAKALPHLDSIVASAKRPAQILVNLFSLCTDLHCPEELWGLLKGLLARKPDWLDGEWYGLEARMAFRDALAANQLDKNLKSLWMAMIRGEGDGWLPGDWESGFDGVLPISASPETWGQPCMDEIGEALKVMSEVMEFWQDRRQKFRGILRRTVSAYPKEAGRWEKELITLADSLGWQAWSVESLPSLYVPLEERPNGGTRAYVWHLILSCLPAGEQYETKGSLCFNRVLDVEMDPGTTVLVENLAPLLEEARLSSDLSSDRSLAGVLAHAISEQETVALSQKDDPTAVLLEEARRNLLVRVGLLPDVPRIAEALKSERESDSQAEWAAKFQVVSKVILAIYPENHELQQEMDRLRETIIAA